MGRAAPLRIANWHDSCCTEPIGTRTAETSKQSATAFCASRDPFSTTHGTFSSTSDIPCEARCSFTFSTHYSLSQTFLVARVTRTSKSRLGTFGTRYPSFVLLTACRGTIASAFWSALPETATFGPSLRGTAGLRYRKVLMEDSPYHDAIFHALFFPLSVCARKKVFPGRFCCPSYPFFFLLFSSFVFSVVFAVSWHDDRQGRSISQWIGTRHASAVQFKDLKSSTRPVANKKQKQRRQNKKNGSCPLGNAGPSVHKCRLHGVGSGAVGGCPFSGRGGPRIAADCSASPT